MLIIYIYAILPGQKSWPLTPLKSSLTNHQSDNKLGETDQANQEFYLSSLTEALKVSVTRKNLAQLGKLMLVSRSQIDDCLIVPSEYKLVKATFEITLFVLSTY